MGESRCEVIMSAENLFDVVFKGKFVRELDKNRAVLHFSKVFKLPIEKAERFFDGNPRVLKKDQVLEKANNFRQALKKAGLKVSLVKKVNENFKAELTMSAPGVVLVNPPQVVPADIPTSGISLDEVGAQFANPEPVEPVNIDTSSFTIDEEDREIVEKEEIPEPEFDVSSISLDEVGAIFDEPQDIPEPHLDLSDLSLDEVGATIVEKKPTPPVEIDTSSIKLLD